MNSKKQKLQEPKNTSWGWYVATEDAYSFGGDYLHSDLNIHDSAYDSNSSGYFSTKVKAEAAIKKYYAKWDGSNPSTDPTYSKKAFDKAMKGI